MSSRTHLNLSFYGLFYLVNKSTIYYYSLYWFRMWTSHYWLDLNAWIGACRRGSDTLRFQGSYHSKMFYGSNTVNRLYQNGCFHISWSSTATVLHLPWFHLEYTHHAVLVILVNEFFWACHVINIFTFKYPKSQIAWIWQTCNLT